MLVIGTSAIVYPAAQLPVVAKQHGAKIVEINIESAFPDADHVVLEKAGTAMARILEAIKSRRAV
jgi:NAD-dependent deacetylase